MELTFNLIGTLRNLGHKAYLFPMPHRGSHGHNNYLIQVPSWSLVIMNWFFYSWNISPVYAKGYLEMWRREVVILFKPSYLPLLYLAGLLVGLWRANPLQTNFGLPKQRWSIGIVRWSFLSIILSLFLKFSPLSFLGESCEMMFLRQENLNITTQISLVTFM